MIDRKKILIIVGIILLMVVIDNNQQLVDNKKEANPFSAISGGLVAVVIGGILWATGAMSGLVVGIIALIWGATRVGGGIWEWIYPTPAIPMWVWIAGFAILFFMVTRKK